ncbi:MAG: hypothetical protein A3B23_01780 [Candidatus Colwellbacteria bacterium RIFCSPLOWO2_01_FULL_48_10]|uniref:Extracellular solute-binding protein n=1 Tax=Candidatus Colwellbacteria bacterium RIFCSPLOWO2_01_FULL_48_10 TaxID=1797690 RepID=A0A1G1Z6Y3_9BACT|nr:MAG: hypothetical protein A3B23_01780 [Candidatus Colwellbacteria bacterium RIFCSPLOWO2_01_FULL_48_10]
MTKAAIALGSSEDFVVNSTDILTSIMMQVGVQMVDASTGKVSFYSQKGLQALKFYADFADPLSPNYAWDDSIGNSIDAFAQGKTAMAFLYSSQLPAVRARNPLLMPNVGVLPLPQFNQDSSANLASFWAMAVSNRVSNYAAAWNFINFAATDRSAASSYVSSTGNPPALRSLISDYRQNSSLKVFVSQALIATDWPVPDDRKVRTIFDNMIESYLKDKLSADNILKTAQEEVASIIKR